MSTSGHSRLPVAIPRSDTLWRMLTGGYDCSYVDGLPDGHRDKRALIDQAEQNWAQIRGEDLAALEAVQ